MNNKVYCFNINNVINIHLKIKTTILNMLQYKCNNNNNKYYNVVM